MEANFKSLLSRLLGKENSQSDKEANGPSSDGDGMDVIEPDRVGTSDSSTSYSVDSDLTASTQDAYAAHHYNPKTGEMEYLWDEKGKVIDSAGLFSSSADKKEWLGKQYTPTNGVIKDAGEKVSAEELVTVGSGQVANRVEGTLDKPNTINKVVPNSLFIDGKSYQEDIRQGNLGDCYFLAAILQVVHYDQNYIPNMMHMVGDEVYTELYHREGNKKSNYHWVRKPIAIKWGLNQMTGKDSAGNTITQRIGANYRLKYEPEKEVKWSANFDADTLKINRTTFYQAAMWVNCLERAFADYSNLYGQYGVGKSRYYTSSDRYNTINGGFPGYCLNMIYGDDAQASAQGDSSYGTPISRQEISAESDKTSMLDGAENLLGNLATLSQTQDGSKTSDMHISIWSYDDTIIPRINYYAKSVKAELDEYINTETDSEKVESYKRASAELDSVLVNASAYAKAASVAGREGSKSEDQRIAADALHDNQTVLASNSDFIALGIEDYLSLRSTIATIVSKSEKDFYIYTCHAYNIREIHFVDKEGNPINVDDLYAYYVNGKLDPDYDPNQQEADTGSSKKKSKKKTTVEYKLNIAALKDLIDLDKTTVIIQNPHAQTKAVYPGQEYSRAAEGTWASSLRELLANTDSFTAVTVNNHRHDDVAEVDAVDAAEGEKEVQD